MKKKKLFSGILLLSAAFILTSCVWKIDNDLSAYTGKSTIKDFSSLNTPIILCYNLNQSFSLYGNEDLKQQSRHIGNVYAIYDWESNQIFDWIFLGYQQNCQASYAASAKASDGSLHFLDKSGSYDVIQDLNSKTKGFSECALKVQCQSTSWAKNFNMYSQYQIAINEIYNDEDANLILDIYDSNSQTFGQSLKINTNLYDSSNPIIADPEGNYWYVYYSGELGQNEYAKVAKIDPEENSLTEITSLDMHENMTYDEYEGWQGSDYFQVISADESYVILESNPSDTSVNSERLLFIDKSTGNTSHTVEIPDESLETSLVFATNKIGDYYYVISAAKEQDK
ncbi:MAG: hypothetical protein K5839_05515, partial [Treponemataceae bacterium]|nr:hypothetical protein [Treponemataceae bacterium]